MYKKSGILGYKIRRIVTDNREFVGGCAVGELTGGDCFLLVVLYDGGNILETVRVVRSLTDTPILVLRECMTGQNKLPPLKPVQMNISDIWIQQQSGLPVRRF